MDYVENSAYNIGKNISLTGAYLFIRHRRPSLLMLLRVGYVNYQMSYKFYKSNKRGMMKAIKERFKLNRVERILFFFA